MAVIHMIVVPRSGDTDLSSNVCAVHCNAPNGPRYLFGNSSRRMQNRVGKAARLDRSIATGYSSDKNCSLILSNGIQERYRHDTRQGLRIAREPKKEIPLESERERKYEFRRMERKRPQVQSGAESGVRQTELEWQTGRRVRLSRN